MGHEPDLLRLHITYSTDDPPIGLHAHGFDPSGGAAVGPWAYTATPTTSVWNMRVSPGGSQTRGFVWAHYWPSGGADWYHGVAPITVNGPGWHTVDALPTSLTWTHRDPSNPEPTPGDAGNETVAAFAASHGGDQGGALLGFGFGCDGEVFVYDGLRVGAPGSVITHDFEGIRTQALMLTGDKTVRAGSKVRLRGIPDPADARHWDHEMILEARRFGSEDFREVGRATSTYDSASNQQLPAEVTVAPRVRTEY